MCRPYLSLFYEHCSYASGQVLMGFNTHIGRTQQQGIEQGCHRNVPSTQDRDDAVLIRMIRA